MTEPANDDRYPVVIPDTDYYRQMIKCQSACPVLTDARAYVTAVARGDLEEGYRIAHDPNPLSTICGRICGAPCEDACRRRDVEPDFSPVAIRSLKRVLTERYGPEAPPRQPGDAASAAPQPSAAEDGKTRPGQGAPTLYSSVRWSREQLLALAATPGRKRGRVAVVGAGPSGLAAAHDLASLGHQVTIYEAGPKTGGMMRYGVPAYRIDQRAMDAQVQSILDLGVEIKFNTSIGQAIKLSDLRRECDAVYLGLGLMRGLKLNVEGADLDGVITAVDLLFDYNLGRQVMLGKRVIVAGGGDAAMDAARTALRLGAQVSLVVYRRSRAEMPARAEEIHQAEEEGIQIHPYLAPSRILGRDGKVVGLETIEAVPVSGNGRRSSLKLKPGTEKLWECDTVVWAIGQSADLGALGGADDVKLSPQGLIEINPDTGQTSAPDVFAGGDAAYGARLIIHAVHDGHVAALGIEQKIQGRSLKTEVKTTWTELPGHAMHPGWTQQPRIPVPVLSVDRRADGAVVELGYSGEQARTQGQRCLECSVNTVFDGTKCILCNGCVDVCPWNCLKIVSLDQIQGDATLTTAIEKLAGRQTQGVAAMLKDDQACTRCALCADRCPTGAITMEAFRFKETLAYG